jgi:hypothetical protein
MIRCGLEDRLEEILHTLRDVAAPHFAKELDRIEQVRLAQPH